MPYECDELSNDDGDDAVYYVCLGKRCDNGRSGGMVKSKETTFSHDPLATREHLVVLGGDCYFVNWKDTVEQLRQVCVLSLSVDRHAIAQSQADRLYVPTPSSSMKATRGLAKRVL